MRGLLVACLAVVTACASAGQEGPGGSSGDDEPSGPQGGDDEPDAGTPCNDVDNDGVCAAEDVCPGADDRLDSDLDTVPDGCDQCPGADDRTDQNTNGVPDCTELAPLQTRTIPLKTVGANYWRGRHGPLGYNPDLDNTFTGDSPGTGVLNSFFIFSLAGFPATSVESVTLRLEVSLYPEGGAGYGDAETISVWDVTTAPATVEGTAGNQPSITTDLQSGISFGTFSVPRSAVNTVLDIPLNASAVTDARAKLGQDFAVGLHLDTAPGYVVFSLNNEDTRVNELVIKYR